MDGLGIAPLFVDDPRPDVLSGGLVLTWGEILGPIDAHAETRRSSSRMRLFSDQHGESANYYLQI